jgi:uracil-DNA glycosylase family 4
MATRISKLTLPELYELPKMTPAVVKAIVLNEDFSSIKPSYCDKVCKLSCKSYDRVQTYNTPVDIVIVQDYTALPGKFDKREGQQEDKMMQITDSILRAAGVSGLTYRVLTLLKCSPSARDFPRGRPPTQTTLLKCSPYLHQELRSISPKVIVSTSTACTKALGLSKHSNTGDRGKIVDSEFGKVVITQHPRILTYIRQNAINASSGYWSADFYGVIRRDFEKAVKLARGEFYVKPLEEGVRHCLQHNIRICRSLEDVKRYTDEILALPPNALVSWDIETTGFSGWAPDAKLLCTQFAYRRAPGEDYTSVVIPLWHRMNRAYDPDEAWAMVVPILTGPTRLIGWNVKFDRVYTAAATGVLAQNIVMDGLLAYHMLDSGINGCYSLKSAVTDFMPESGLAGYEDSLPKLTRKKPDDGSREAEEDEAEGSSESSEE